MTLYVTLDVREDHPKPCHTFIEVRCLHNGRPLHTNSILEPVSPTTQAAVEQVRDAASLCLLALLSEIMP